MSGYEDDSGHSGVLGHSLKLAAAVVVLGLAMVFIIDRGDAGGQGSASRTAPASATAPSSTPGLSELVLQAGDHGHFTVEARVNGTPITFLVDTGASSIYLTPDDAARLGWTPQRLTYTERYSTASGMVHAAPVTLRTLRIGQLELYDLPASVGQQPSSISLLGMTFLKRFESYEVRGDRLILSW